MMAVFFTMLALWVLAMGYVFWDAGKRREELVRLDDMLLEMRVERARKRRGNRTR